MTPFSNFLTLNQRDFLKGLFMAVAGAVAGLIISELNHDGIEWKIIGTTALTTALTYLVKNFFTNNKDQIFKQ
jgi:membrane protein implicated in regulation of membrane protease activity